jgi:hypothetical protein
MSTYMQHMHTDVRMHTLIGTLIGGVAHQRTAFERQKVSESPSSQSLQRCIQEPPPTSPSCRVRLTPGEKAGKGEGKEGESER